MLNSMMTQNLSCGYNCSLIRKWHSVGTLISPSNFIFPIFLKEGDPLWKEEVPALPHQFHFGIQSAIDYLRPLIRNFGLSAVLIFGVPDPVKPKDGRGTLADDPQGPVVNGLRELRKVFSKDELLLVADVCLCAYTESGHCGILGADGRSCDVISSSKRLAEVAVTYANAGADVIAPSDMMDTRISMIKQVLADNALSHIPVMSYAAKFCSGLYGPFRNVCATNLKGDRASYQLPPASSDLAERAVRRDLNAGADFIMIKPGSFYLDILKDVKRIAKCPIAVYHVSGEYAMIWHAAEAGSIKLKDTVLELMCAFRRAGADLIITYYTPMILEWLSARDFVQDTNLSSPVKLKSHI